MATPVDPARTASGHQARVLAVIKQHVNFTAAGDDWKSKKELPAADELLQSQDKCEALPHNPIDRPWASKEAYLATQYKILRREGIEGLRYSTNAFKRDPSMSDDKNTCVYTDVRIKGYLMTRIGPVCRIEFSTRRAGCKIKWQQSKRLTPGTAVAVTTAKDNFQTICKVATVAQRPFTGGLDQNPPEIDISWANPEDAVFDPEEELVMVESRNGYFEAVRHALVGLQHAAETFSPIEKCIIACSQKDAAPVYVQKSPIIDVSSLVHHLPETVDRSSPTFNEVTELLKAKEPLRSHNILEGLPHVKDVSTLDDSQLQALHRIVSKEIAIVQGPPGTGKTFTSVSALKVLLANRQRGDPPIIVAAQTNHALDQLLHHCHDAGANILRVGGRTEDELISTRTVYALRQLSGFGPDKNYRNLEASRRSNIDDVQKLVENVFSDELLNPIALLEARVITRSQYDSLMDDEWETAGDSAESDNVLGRLGVWLGDKIMSGVHIRQKWPDFEEEEDEDELAKEYEVDLGLDQILDDDEDKDRLHGTWIPISHRWTGRPARNPRESASAEKYLAEYDDVWDIPPIIRGAVYQLMQKKLLAVLSQDFRGLLQRAEETCKKLKINKWSKDIRLMRDQCIDIVGCTTTGLTKYRGFLAAMNPRTLLIEEAAETREANVTSALYPSIQQLILVGDHQQLTPHCDIRILGNEPYHLNVSMFQRLVKVGIPFTMLNQQRRMKPELRHILKDFYPALTDHPEVLLESQRPSVPGMGGRNCWLFHHDWPEETDFDQSKFNVQEAEMITKFVAYLMNNGVKSSQITILTFYNGQRKVILKTLKREPSINTVANQFYNVFTVDSYQGEENDIVLLSLVRSPKVGNNFAVGFLEDENRAVVAISRARRGFYIFGNVNNILAAHDKSFELWGRVFNGFATQERVRRQHGIPIVCQKHGTECWFKEPDHFVGNAGGCWVKCTEKLPCGHDCKLYCHPQPHSTVSCLDPCPRILNCGHHCENRCADKCYCHCGNYEAPLQLEPQMGTSRDTLMEKVLHPSLDEVLNDGKATNTTTTTTRAITPRNRQGRGGYNAGRGRGSQSRGGLQTRGGPQSRGGFQSRGARSGFVNKARSNIQAQLTSPTPRPSGYHSTSSSDSSLHPAPAPVPVARTKGGHNQWKEFVKNVDHHDEQARQTRRGLAKLELQANDQSLIAVEGLDGNNSSLDKQDHVIKETFTQTDIINGRRTTGKPVCAAAVDGPLRTQQPAYRPDHSGGNMGLDGSISTPSPASQSHGQHSPFAPEHGAAVWVAWPPQGRASQKKTPASKESKAAAPVSAHKAIRRPQPRQPQLRPAPAGSGNLFSQQTVTNGPRVSHARTVSSSGSNDSGRGYGFDAEVLGVRKPRKSRKSKSESGDGSSNVMSQTSMSTPAPIEDQGKNEDGEDLLIDF